MLLSVLSTYFLSRSRTRFLTAGFVASERRSGFTTATTAPIMSSVREYPAYLEISLLLGGVYQTSAFEVSGDQVVAFFVEAS